MAGLPFKLEQRPNAEFMSPTGFGKWKALDCLNFNFQEKFPFCECKIL
jgi:hypothetical protein